ncbi:MAG: AraC family transcriptional regulator [Clostridiales bacterium]|nr:AraC family transcriptional regulator [Clostridiales bacterium]
MKVKELLALLDAKCVTENADLEAEISCGYSCDLLSWVLAHGKQGMAWCTVQTHVNVIAVSVLMEMACVILVEGVEAEEASLKKAIDEGMPVLSTTKTAYEVCGIMNKAGIAAPVE